MPVSTLLAVLGVFVWGLVAAAMPRRGPRPESPIDAQPRPARRRAADPARPPAPAWLIGATVLAPTAAVASVGPLLMSLMIFTAPPNPPTLVAFFCLATFPVVCVLSVAVAWVASRSGFRRLAAAAAFAPLVNVAFGAATVAWVQVALGGRLH